MTDFTPVTSQTFQKEVLESPRPTVVDFGAPWCGPCKQIDPLLKQLAADWGERARFVKVNVDECPDLTQRYGIMTVPTVLLFVGGQLRERLNGLQPKDRIAGKLLPHIA